jgi:hypothetical protein
MTQPKHALPKRRPQILDDVTGQTNRADARAHKAVNPHQDASLHGDATQKDALAQDALHQDAWITNFIGRLAGLVRNTGGKK